MNADTPEDLDKLVKTTMHIGYAQGKIHGCYCGIIMSLIVWGLYILIDKMCR